MQAREHVRQAYLDAMGIQTWFPRQVLPNAQPARTFEWLTESDTTHFQEPTPAPAEFSVPTVPVATKPAPSKRLSSTDILNSVSPVTETVDQQKKSTPAPPASTQPALTISKFRLVVISPAPDCLIVAEMPYTGLNQFTRYHHRLLQDLTRALKLPLPPAEDVREFTWPLESISAHHGLFSQISQDDKAAADAVNAFLCNQYGLPRRKTVLLLGQAAAHFVFDRVRSFDELRGVHTRENSEQTFAVSHGLSELMKIPSLKPETWQDLKPLISQLN